MLQVLKNDQTTGLEVVLEDPTPSGKIGVYLTGRVAQTWGLQSYLDGVWSDVIAGKDNAHDTVNMLPLIGYRLKVSAMGPKGFFHQEDGDDYNIVLPPSVISSLASTDLGIMSPGESKILDVRGYFENDPRIGFHVVEYSVVNIGNSVVSVIENDHFLKATYAVGPSDSNDITVTAKDRFGRTADKIFSVRTTAA